MEQTADYFLSLNTRICEVYGMSENCGFCGFKIDSQGFHFIVGREKELIITSAIHERVIENLPIISQVNIKIFHPSFKSVFSRSYSWVTSKNIFLPF